MTIAEKAPHTTVRAIVRLFGQTEDDRLQSIDERLSRRDRTRERTLRVLAWLAAALALSGCAAAQPSIVPIAPRIVQREEWGTCVETGGKITVPQAGTVALLTSACWAQMDAGAPDASEPEPTVVVPDKTDAGASE